MKKGSNDSAAAGASTQQSSKKKNKQKNNNNSSATAALAEPIPLKQTSPERNSVEMIASTPPSSEPVVAAGLEEALIENDENEFVTKLMVTSTARNAKKNSQALALNRPGGSSESSSSSESSNGGGAPMGHNLEEVDLNQMSNNEDESMASSPADVLPIFEHAISPPPSTAVSKSRPYMNGHVSR